MTAKDIFNALNVSLPKEKKSKIDKEKYIDRLVTISVALINNNVNKNSNDIVDEAISILNSIMSKTENI